jgi:uncharacterized protein YjbI with pentapeptide repeats
MIIRQEHVDIFFPQQRDSEGVVIGPYLQGALGKMFKGSELYSLKFNGANLAGLRFDECELHNCDFSNCDMRGVIFTKCKLRNVDFCTASFDGANFEDSVFEDCVFIESEFSNVLVDSSVLSGCSFAHSSWKKVEFKDCSFDFLVLNSVTISEVKGLELVSNEDSKGRVMIYDKTHERVSHPIVSGRLTDVRYFLTYYVKWMDDSYRTELRSLLEELIS